MATATPAQQAKMSLTLIIIFSLSSGLVLGFSLDYWNDANPKYVWEGVTALLLLGIALLHARKVSRLMR